MIEIQFKNAQLKGILRIVDKILYFKYQDSTQAQQIIKELERKGAIIEKSKTGDWIRVDIFKDYESVKLSEEVTIDFTESDYESKIADFYINNYKKAGFVVDVI